MVSVLSDRAKLALSVVPRVETAVGKRGRDVLADEIGETEERVGNLSPHPDATIW